MKKLTNVLALEMVLSMEGVQANQELFDKLSTMKAQFEKKNSSSADRKPTKTQVENLALMEIILDILADGKQKSITEIQQSSTELAEFSNQKMSSLLKKLVDTGRVVKSVEKRKTLFKIAE